MNIKRSKSLLITIVCLMQFTYSISQTSTEHLTTTKISLYDEISEMDSLLFSAYNNSEIELYESMISDDIEFFHDKNGFISSKDRIVKSLKDISEAKQNSSYSIRRELLKNTLEVYEISGYGAMETGEHQFIETSEGNKTITQAKFMHLWKKDKGSWVITKVFSYDHQPVKKKINSNEEIISLTKEQMDFYTGDYQFAPEFVLTIIREGNRLFGLAQGDKIEILPYDIHKFLISRDYSKLDFIINENGTVTGIEMETKKGTMKAPKINN